MKKTMRFLSMAALALVGAVMTGCSSDDDIFDQQPANNGKTVTLTMTVGLNGGGETRALTADGTKTFAAGETMAVIYKKNGGGTAMAVTEALVGNGDITNNGKTATFTVTLDDPDKDENVTYVYPAAMVNSDGTVKNDALAEQDGTLASLSSNLDYCTNSGAWDNGALPELTLDNQFAILAITLKNTDGSSDITSSITGMTIFDGTNTYTVSRSAAAGPIYVAIQPTASADIDVTATDGSTNYTKSLTGKTYEASNGYNVSWKMTQQAPPALNLTSPAVGQVIGNDGKNYDYASLPGSVTAVALICYVNGSNGLALALADEGNMDWSTAKTTCAAHTPAITGGTWLLASKDQWTSMINAAGSYEALRDGFEGVGGTNLQSDPYWSSTEHEVFSDWAYFYHFSDGDCRFGNMTDNRYVRACLAWPQAAPAETADVTWNFSEMTGENPNLNQGYTYKGVTLSGDGNLDFGMGSLMAMGSGFTFTAPTGKKFTKIVITATNQADISGWTNDMEPGNYTSTWTGDASSVSFSGMANGVTSIVFTTAPAETDDVTWDFSELSGTHNLEMSPYTYKDVTLSGNGNLDFDSDMLDAMGGCTFTAPTGKNFKKIVITATNMANISGWTNDMEPGNNTSTWTGDASIVSFSGTANGITSIVFTLEDE